MVALRRETGEGPTVDAIGPGGFRVGNRRVPGGLLLTPEEARDWAPPAVDALTADDFAWLLAMAPPPEFILLGTGATLVRPQPALVQAIEAQGSGLEVMDSRAAARAWGLLRAEARHVGAALYPAG
jgi:uncharacterized protein